MKKKKIQEEDSYNSLVIKKLKPNSDNDIEDTFSLTNGIYPRSYRDFSSLKLKGDHVSRPLWIISDNHIFLETFSPLYRFAYEFLIAIAEPVSRPAYIHEYVLTQYSLYAAMVIRYTPDLIKDILTKLCKNKWIPQEVVDFIDKNTKRYGSARLLLKNNKYYLQIFDPSILNDPTLKKYIFENKLKKIDQNSFNEDSDRNIVASNNIQIKDVWTETDNEKLNEQFEKLISVNTDKDKIESIDIPKLKELPNDIYEITTAKHTEITKSFIDQNIPLIEEFDFQSKGEENDNLMIELKPSTKIRFYQEKALSKVFIAGKARSGVIVLPCGAGKTLVGITAATRVKKRTMIFCNTTLAIQQWKNQFKMFTDVPDERIICLTSKHTDTKKYNKIKNKAFILITTYSMMAKSPIEAKGEKTKEKQQILWELKNKEWGICILDEVQVVPANTFQLVLNEIKSHFKLGLTATLLREDDKIENLNYMIGPKLYEENWLDLVNQGFLARPYCVEIRCPMTPEFSREYKKMQPKDKHLLYGGNPNKFLILQYLIKRHEERGDKIIVFGTRPAILTYYAKKLCMPVLHGKVSHEERVIILDKFQTSRKINTIFLSNIGDTAIDLPSANVVIQISAHFGSRKQEAQRLGRIMRPKENNVDEYTAFFYTVVSQETDETFFASKRQTFLIDQGFSFEIVSDSQLKLPNNLIMNSAEEQLLYLNKILTKFINTNDKDYEDGASSDSDDDDDNDNGDVEFENRNPLNNNTVFIEAKK